MRVFNGVQDPVSNIDWQLNSLGGNVVIPRDSMSTLAMLLFADSTGWINCDYFIDETPIDYSVRNIVSANLDSTQVFLHITGRNAVLREVRRVNNNFEFRSIEGPATIVGVCVVNGILTAGIKSVYVRNGEVTTLDLLPISLDELKNKLKDLR
jgi:hypothetical protein